MLKHLQLIALAILIVLPACRKQGINNEHPTNTSPQTIIAQPIEKSPKTSRKHRKRAAKKADKEKALERYYAVAGALRLGLVAVTCAATCAAVVGGIVDFVT